MAEGTAEWNPDFVMDTAFWSNTWSKDGAKSFHLPYVAGWFTKYADTMLAGRTGVKVLVPFCGKDVCMKWLIDNGHTVVGIECASQGCKEFFEEQKIECIVEEIGKFTLFKNKSGTIKLYCGDFFDFTPEMEGQFGAIWDRGALNTVNGFQRKDYVALMASLMTKDAVYILINFDSEDKKIVEEWDLLTDEKLTELFAEKFDIQLRLEYDDAASQNEGLDPKEMEGLMEKLAVIRLKINDPECEWTPGTVMDPEYWRQSWQKGESSYFTLPKVSGFLTKYIGTLTEGKKSARILVPFCGKDPSMKWLIDQGHTVVGIECVEQGCKEFFKENGIEFVSETHGSFTVYKNTEETLKLYCGDLFQFSSECEAKFDGVWDRGGLNAVNINQQVKYISLMASLVSPAAVYLLLNFDSDDKEVAEKWEYLTDDIIMNLFSENFTVQLRAEYVDAFEMNEGIDMSGMENMKEKLTVNRRK